jgi:drug/metabolite transporter superfamily protein YnfA
MSFPVSLLILLVAALLEVAGDAIVRGGLQTASPSHRILLLLAGAVVLFTYGCVVNIPPWDFGRLLGVYIVFFFIVSQAISVLIFHTRPSVPTLIGGAFVIIGGVIISIGSWR